MNLQKAIAKEKYDIIEWMSDTKLVNWKSLMNQMATE